MGVVSLGSQQHRRAVDALCGAALEGTADRECSQNLGEAGRVLQRPELPTSVTLTYKRDRRPSSCKRSRAATGGQSQRRLPVRCQTSIGGSRGHNLLPEHGM